MTASPPPLQNELALTAKIFKQRQYIVARARSKLHRELMNVATLSIQRAARMAAARAELERLRVLHNSLVLAVAASKIGKCIRGHVTRNSVPPPLPPR